MAALYHLATTYPLPGFLYLPTALNAFQGELVQKLRYLLFPIFFIALYDYIHTSSFQEE